MSDNYQSKEALEHVERAHELLERSEVALLRFVPLLAAVLAIFAGLSSLYAGRLGERALALKNEALLNEVQASDLWTEYQADSLKAHLYEIAGDTTGAQARGKLQRTGVKYRSEQLPLRAQAQRYERDRDAAIVRSEETEARKGGFDIALALFEVSIVLTSIAAMIKRPFLFVLAGIGGIIGVAFSLHGILAGRL